LLHYSTDGFVGQVTFLCNSLLSVKRRSPVKQCVSEPGLWSRKSHHPTPTPGNFDYPTPTPTPDRLRPSAVLVTESDNSFQMNSYTLLAFSRNTETCFKLMEMHVHLSLLQNAIKQKLVF